MSGIAPLPEIETIMSSSCSLGVNLLYAVLAATIAALKKAQIFSFLSSCSFIGCFATLGIELLNYKGLRGVLLGPGKGSSEGRAVEEHQWSS